MEPESPKPPQMNNPERFIPPFRISESVQQPNSQSEKMPSVERGEQKTGAGAGDVGGPTLPPPLLTDQPVQQSVNDTAISAASSTSMNDNPLAADDVDVIEKEWVVRAKQIVNQTKNDPYQQEHEVSKLQADYLRKRFGVEVKLPQD
ncbi:MAG TPA: hypothetical protein VFZ58_03625 [Candidatus Saccharimonadales bacterium]